MLFVMVSRQQGGLRAAAIVGAHCSGVCGCSLAGYRCGHGSYSAGCSHLPDVLIVSLHRCLEAVWNCLGASALFEQL